MAPHLLRDVALLIIDTGLRAGEAAALEWRNVHLKAASGPRFGYVHISSGKSAKAKRNVSLTPRVAAMLETRRRGAGSNLVFSRNGKSVAVTSLDHEHAGFRALLGFPTDFVLHSLRHTMLTRLGETRADAFTIMRIAGHSSVVSQRYVHPSPESLETAFERMDALNRERRGVRGSHKFRHADQFAFGG